MKTTCGFVPAMTYTSQTCLSPAGLLPQLGQAAFADRHLRQSKPYAAQHIKVLILFHENQVPGIQIL